MNAAVSMLTQDQILQFWHQGYLVVSGLLTAEELSALQHATRRLLANPSPPWELEADTGYPGAPASQNALGGQTLRRLKNIVARDALIAEWAGHPMLTGCLRQLFNDELLWLNPNHHNCLMTKEPRFSSDTGWHQDIRYWSFNQPELITAWTALGEENSHNGSLSVIPGSHQAAFDAEQFDAEKFFRIDVDSNRSVLKQEVHLTLQPGDVLLFHCRLLHRATRNFSQQAKRALVFTYHSEGTEPITGTRSTQLPELPL